MAKKVAVALLTGVELCRRAGVSSPTLIKYRNAGLLAKFLVGSGRTAKWKATAVPVVQRLKAKGVARRGRPKA